MLRMRFIIVLAVVVGAFMALASSASASWTNLGGDPLFRGGIQGTGQTARNDFVRKMNTNRAAKAMKRAGLSAIERRAVRSAVNKGKFRRCTLHYGDRFQRMSFGAGTIFVDRNVTFADPRYKSSGSPAFCLTVKVKKKGGKVTTIKLKVPFKCFNIAVVSKKTTKKHKKTPKKVVVPTIPPPGPGCVVIVNGDNNGNAGCGNVQICTANGDYSGNPTVCSAYANCIAVQGNTWNSTQNVCSSAPPPPPPCTQNCTSSVLILSMTDLNDIPTGKSSGPYYVEVSASDVGGTLTVDPGIGSITDCNGGSREGSMTLPVPKGVTKFCFVIWAPDDPAKPSQMTVTATAVLGNSSAHKEDVLGITYPIRPE